jgi:Flp pilus assembly protein TadG
MLVRRGKSPIRRGAAMAEAAISLPVFLTLCLGMIDLGIAVFQNNAVAEASRQAARIASVHGSLAPSGWNGGDWMTTAGVTGTSAYSVAGNDSGAIATAINGSGALAGLKPANVTITITWIDGGDKVQSGHRVQVAISTNWSPVFFYVFGNKTVTLTATSIMPIAH